VTEEANQPLVSVIMPCYKMGRFIGDALESVGKQTFQNWEVIAVDDCGPEDGTREVVEGFAKKFSNNRILCQRHEKNAGVSAARNTAIGLAEGEYLAFLDPDDWWSNNHLQRIFDAFSNANDIGGIACAGYRCKYNGEKESKIQFYKKWEQDLFPYIMAIRNGFAMSGVALRKSLFSNREVFDEDPRIQHAEDWDLWLRLIGQDVRFHLDGEPSCYYRKHESAATKDYNKVRERLRYATNKNKNIINDFQTVALGKMVRIMGQMQDDIEITRLNCKVKSGSFIRNIFKKIFTA